MTEKELFWQPGASNEVEKALNEWVSENVLMALNELIDEGELQSTLDGELVFISFQKPTNDGTLDSFSKCFDLYKITERYFEIVDSYEEIDGLLKFADKLDRCSKLIRDNEIQLRDKAKYKI